MIARTEGLDGFLTIERAPNYRHREVLRAQLLGQHVPAPGGVLAPTRLKAVSLPEDYVNFVAPDDEDFQPGHNGWHYIAGCWHAPVSVCRCFVKQFVEDYLRATTGAAVAAS